jgi:membrane associated rhomboid family serine protease
LFGGLFLLTLLGAGGERVDVLGHALGFAMGTLLGWAYARLGIPRTRDRRPQWAAGGAAVAVIMAAWLLALRR